MHNTGPTPETAANEAEIQAETSQGQAIRGPLHRLGRYQVAFELPDPGIVLRSSEALEPFRVYLSGRLVYNGRAIISSLVQTGTGIVCEASLAETGLDVALIDPTGGDAPLAESFGTFMNRWQKLYRVLPEFKIAIGDLQSFLIDLRNWLQQVELTIHAAPDGARDERTREVMESLAPRIKPAIAALFDRFEHAARQVAPELVRAHQIYSQRQLHPLLLASPFVYRTLAKPLGHPGDFEMVNMMVRSPFEGGSLFARAVNAYALDLPPILAHRNRLKALTDRLREETARWQARGKPLHALSIGCGPAQEVHEFLWSVDWSDHASFTLLDFDEQTLGFTMESLTTLKHRLGRRTPLHSVRRSVQSLLQQAGRGTNPFGRANFEFIYCAGLFDYLPDHVCKRLMDYLHRLLAPGGLLMATNVDDHPARGQMEYFLEWHLIYRDAAGMARLAPSAATPDECSVVTDPTGVNIYLEVRSPET